MDVVTLLLAIGATARITRLITEDKIFERPRDWILDRVPPEGAVTYFLSCPWCVSIYTGSAVATAAALQAGTLTFMIPAAALTASYATGFLASLGD